MAHGEDTRACYSPEVVHCRLSWGTDFAARFADDSRNVPPGENSPGTEFIEIGTCGRARVQRAYRARQFLVFCRYG